MSVLIKGFEMPETGYMDVRIFRDGTAAIATGTKPYYRELKAEPVRHGKWIPVSERLPEYDEEVLCQTVGGNMMVLFRSERTNEWTDGLYYSEPSNMIVAWRELPKPYREF